MSAGHANEMRKCYECRETPVARKVKIKDSVMWSYHCKSCGFFSSPAITKTGARVAWHRWHDPENRALRRNRLALIHAGEETAQWLNSGNTTGKLSTSAAKAFLEP